MENFYNYTIENYTLSSEAKRMLDSLVLYVFKIGEDYSRTVFILTYVFMIKAIAFDLGGCLILENDIEMTPQEEVLEKEFWILNFDQEYFSWASQTLSISEEEVKSILTSLFPKLYSLREEWIFEKIQSQFPDMTFAIATNHISLIKESLRYLWVLKRCPIVLISWDCWYEKPDRWFYQLLIDKLWLLAEEILFVDDSEENILGAEKSWLNTLLYHRDSFLSESVLWYLHDMNQ